MTMTKVGSQRPQPYTRPLVFLSQPKKPEIENQALEESVRSFTCKAVRPR